MVAVAAALAVAVASGYGVRGGSGRRGELRRQDQVVEFVVREVRVGGVVEVLG